MGKKILFLLPSSGFGGCELYAVNLMLRLREGGNNVIVAFRINGDTNDLKQLCDLNFIEYINLRCDHRGDTFKSPLLLVKKIIEVYRVVRAENPDVVSINLPWPTFGLPFLLTCGLLKIRTIVIYHSVPEVFKLQRIRAGILRIFQRRNQSWVVLSKHMAEIVANAYKISLEKLYIIPHGINPKKFPFLHRGFNKTGDELIKIVSVGRLSYMKGFDILFVALKELKHLNWHCTIYGDGEERSNLEELILHHRLNNRITLKGMVSEIARELNNFDLFVFPTRFEGFGLALFEAVFNGLPVITSDAKPISDYIKDGYNGLVFKVGDTQSLQKKLEFALENYNLLETFVKNSTKLREDLEEDIVVDKTIALHLN